MCRKKKEVVDLSPETQSRYKNEKNATDVSTVETLQKRTEGKHKKIGHAVDKKEESRSFHRNTHHGGDDDLS